MILVVCERGCPVDRWAHIGSVVAVVYVWVQLASRPRDRTVFIARVGVQLTPSLRHMFARTHRCDGRFDVFSSFALVRTCTCVASCQL